MAFKYYLIIVVSFLLTGCAEVGIISGGPKDEIAPKVVKSSIEKGTTNFRGESIELTFDEFVQLNKPSENIILVPQHAQLDVQLVKKSLKIKLSNELKNNTTYTLYLNAAVKDVNEGNDSLMHYTFSTGPILDSLRFTAIVSEAFSNQVKNKIVVGLFDSLNAEKPIYFGQTNQAGIVTLSAIQEGTYFCKAFEDKNKDLQIQKDEAQDHIFQSIRIDTSYRDTVNFRISVPKSEEKIKNIQILAPGIITAHIPDSNAIESIKLNGIESKKYFYPKKDSLVIAIGTITESPIQLELNKDTFQLNYSQKDKLKPLKAKYIEVENGTSQFLKFRYRDIIKSINSKCIFILNLKDSTEVPFFADKPHNDEVQIQLLDNNAMSIRISMKDSCIQFESGKFNSPEELIVNRRQARELGTLNVKLSKSLNFGIIQLIQKGSILEEKQISDGVNYVQFSNLLPGEYYFKVIFDSNGDGEWNPIDVRNQREAEKVLNFSTPIKVRANWEVETILELNDNN